MKKIICLIIAAMAVFSLASCQLSTIIPPETTAASTTDSVTSGGDSETSAPEIETPTFDYMGTDLTQYVTLCNYKGIKITDVRIDVTDDIVDRFIGELLIGADKYTKVKTGNLAEYDVVNMDYVGKVDGVAFSGGSAMNVAFLVTENSDYIFGLSDNTNFTPGYNYIPGFATEMIGKDVSAPFDINVKFPENYGNDLAGKDAVFTITINYVYSANELSADNLSSITETETVDAFKTEVKEALASDYSDIARNEMDVEIWDYLVENCEFKALPDEYIDEYYNSEFAAVEALAQMYGYTTDEILKLYGYASADEFKEEIVYTVKQSIIIYQILKDENLDLDDAAYKEKLDELAKQQGTTADVFEQEYTKEDLLDFFRFEAVTEFVYSSAEYVKPE